MGSSGATLAGARELTATTVSELLSPLALAEHVVRVAVSFGIVHALQSMFVDTVQTAISSIGDDDEEEEEQQQQDGDDCRQSKNGTDDDDEAASLSRVVS